MIKQIAFLSTQTVKDLKFFQKFRSKNVLLVCILVMFPFYSFAQPLAQGEDKYLGCAIDSKIYSNFDDYWNQVTPGNAGKWESVERGQDQYNWSQLDDIYNYAKSKGFTYKHHTLIWGNQQPSWITSLDSADQRAQIEEWIRLVGARYPDMDFVDVVNEPFNAPPAYMNALGGTGTTGWDWIITAFQLARQYCAPGVKLVLNEYNILHRNSATTNYLALIDTLNVRGLIDAIGIQGHYFEFKSYAGGTPSYTYSISTIEYNLNRLTATGLPVYITEFDINEADDKVQLENYKTYFPVFWENPGVKGITLWGYIQGDVWKQNAYLVTDRGKERPALEWLRVYIVSPKPPELIFPNLTGNVPRNPTLIWYSSEWATSYHLQVSTGIAFTSLVVDTTIADTLIQLKPLVANRRIYWRVSATNQYGTSEYSATASFITGEQTTNVSEIQEIPSEFTLFQNYPNPFAAKGSYSFGGNPATTITFSLPRRTLIKLVLVNIQGKEVMKIANGEFEAGIHHLQMSPSNLSSGVYFYRLEAGNLVSTAKVMLLK